MMEPSRAELKYQIERQKEETKTVNEVGRLISSRPANLSSPGRAKRFEMSSWCSASRLTPKRPLSPIAATVADRSSMQARTSGGSRLTEQNALTVKPTGSPRPFRLVTIVTPLAN